MTQAASQLPLLLGIHRSRPLQVPRWVGLRRHLTSFRCLLRCKFEAPFALCRHSVLPHPHISITHAAKSHSQCKPSVDFSPSRHSVTPAVADARSPAVRTYSTSRAAAMAADQAYLTKPLPGSAFGVEVKEFSLTHPIDPDVIERIKQDVSRHQIVVFRDQGIVSGEDQVRISRRFGQLESTFYKHPHSPHPDVFRVSNDRQHGCTGVGRTGWHIDGSFMPKPFAYSVYHIWSVPKAGSTVFASLPKLVQALPEEQRQKWDRLWPISDRRSGVVHPLIYKQRTTGRQTMCFHTGMIDTFLWDADTPQQRQATPLETVQILDEIDRTIRGPLGQSIQYEHVWQPGDFIISDNLAVAHEAHPSTQLPVSKVGLRVMHRCTIAGEHEPAKEEPSQAAAG